MSLPSVWFSNDTLPESSKDGLWGFLVSTTGLHFSLSLSLFMEFQIKTRSAQEIMEFLGSQILFGYERSHWQFCSTRPRELVLTGRPIRHLTKVLRAYNDSNEAVAEAGFLLGIGVRA